MKLIIPLLSLIAFLWLAAQKPVEHGYSASDIEAVNMLTANPNRAQIMRLYDISEDEVSRPVNLWRNE